MNTDTGDIARFDTLSGEAKKFFTKVIEPRYLTAQKKLELQQTGKTKVHGNDYCPCGSNKKFKNCCYTGE